MSRCRASTIRPCNFLAPATFLPSSLNPPDWLLSSWRRRKLFDGEARFILLWQPFDWGQKRRKIIAEGFGRTFSTLARLNSARMRCTISPASFPSRTIRPIASRALARSGGQISRCGPGFRFATGYLARATADWCCRGCLRRGRPWRWEWNERVSARSIMRSAFPGCCTVCGCRCLADGVLSDSI
jgi:hypothetical protein